MCETAENHKIFSRFSYQWKNLHFHLFLGKNHMGRQTFLKNSGNFGQEKVVSKQFFGSHVPDYLFVILSQTLGNSFTFQSQVLFSIFFKEIDLYEEFRTNWGLNLALGSTSIFAIGLDTLKCWHLKVWPGKGDSVYVQRMCCSFYWYLTITKSSPAGYLGMTTTFLHSMVDIMVIP